MDIGAIIRERALANGVDPAVLAQIVRVESNNNPNASASGSTAKGLVQATDSTFRHYAPSGADPFDPTTSADVGAKLLKDNTTGLASAGLPTSPGALYLAHFAGLGGARSLLSADPTSPAGDVLGQAAVKANPFLAHMTVADLKNWASTKMGGDPTATPTATVTDRNSAPSQPTGLLNSDSAPAPQQDDGSTQQALASIQSMENQQPEAPPPMQQMLPPPMAPRRIDPAMLQKMLSSPLRSGFTRMG